MSKYWLNAFIRQPGGKMIELKLLDIHMGVFIVLNTKLIKY